MVTEDQDSRKFDEGKCRTASEVLRIFRPQLNKSEEIYCATKLFSGKTQFALQGLGERRLLLKIIVCALFPTTQLGIVKHPFKSSSIAVSAA
jgi:hypothetical protein